MQRDAAVLGLSSAQARERLERAGPNVVPSGRRGVVRTAISIVQEPMLLLLVIAGAVYALLGERIDAIAIGVAIVLVLLVTLLQEVRSERAIQALADLSSPRALVIRDGEPARIPGSEVVPGDILVLNEGDRVPADAQLIEHANLQADESLLTGESAPVLLDENRQDVFAGTLLVAGSGLARVTATGSRTRMGAIGKSLQSVQTVSTPLQRKAARVVRQLAIIGLALSAIVVAIFGFLHNQWLDGTLSGVSTAISLLPEEIPVVMMIAFALGARRIARANVLTRRMPAVEALGSATVLCVDKTGTLTMNRMRVAKVMGTAAVSEETVLDCAILASRSEPFDPMERAIHDAVVGGMPGAKVRTGTSAEAIREYPLSSAVRAMTLLWPLNAGDLLAVTKGAPESVLPMCRMNETERARWLGVVDGLAADAFRVIAVSMTRSPHDPPADRGELLQEFVGLIAFQDPVRPGVTDSIRECHSAGIRVIMITGDHPVTARAVAAEIDLPYGESVITGADLDAMGDDAVSTAVADTGVFARIAPEQKLRLVSALKTRGEVVAMTGDGVNDAPALKAADIGVAMGMRGTDVAREAASLVLLDDDFSSIVKAVRLGRRIFENLRNATAYIVAVHILIAGIVLIPAILLLPLIMLPIHLVLLELVIDPACALVFEAQPESPLIMRRPPIAPDAPLMSSAAIRHHVVRGIVALSAPLAIFAYCELSGYSSPETRTAVFLSVVLANVTLIVTSTPLRFGARRRKAQRNLPALWLLVATLLGMALIMAFPPLRSVLQFARPELRDIAIVLGGELFVLVVLTAVSGSAGSRPLTSGILIREGETPVA
jgi:Ca2+-transporting ATPase